MFSQRKSYFKNRWFALAIIGLLGLGYLVNQEKDPGRIQGNENHEIGISQRIDTESSYEVSEGYKNDENDGSEHDEFVGAKPYYLVKEDAGIISIYYCNEEGEQSLLSKTDIAFDLLGESDQALFTKGIVKTSKEDLEELLQDFGS